MALSWCFCLECAAHIARLELPEIWGLIKQPYVEHLESVSALKVVAAEGPCAQEQKR